MGFLFLAPEISVLRLFCGREGERAAVLFLRAEDGGAGLGFGVRAVLGDVCEEEEGRVFAGAL